MRDLTYADRTDTVEEKLRLLQEAARAGHHELAMSLAESIKDTLTFARGQKRDGEPQIGAQTFSPVSELPSELAAWARGWEYFKPLTLFEEVGIARSREPVDLLVEFRVDQTADLAREVRVARIDLADGVLREVPSQVYGEKRGAGERSCRLVFPADVPLHGSASYLILYGNPHAERPGYLTDLRAGGEGYALDISSRYYTARLSRQMGQLERVTLARQHGLELYAGGKGHGEPPTIDWAHDYVDEGGFQKLRVKDWAGPPSFEVVKGPLLVQVRRWGFPHSPLHPVFTPSRMHIDVAYRFYAGLPYFVKESRMEAVKDVNISAMRDDEWVFSGYSFTDQVWIDRAGRLHEGPVPGEHSRDLWGVGFYHRESRDAFIALWLEHGATGFDGIEHGGAPTLSYPGHGQLWSRYPANSASLKKGAAFRQKNAYLVLPYPADGAAASVERMRHELSHPLVVSGETRLPAGVGRSTGGLARSGETPETAPMKPAIWNALREVKDEQLYTIDANVVDMGLVYDVRVRGGTVEVTITMPHRGRPEYNFFVSEGGGRVGEGIRERLEKLAGVRDVVVSFTWDPPWSAARLSDEGRRALGLA